MMHIAISMLLTLGTVIPLWGGEPQRLLLVPDASSSAGENLLKELEIELTQRLEAIPHFELVLKEEEREMFLREWEQQLSDIFAEKYQVKIGELRGAEYILRFNTYQGNAPKYRFEVMIYDLKTGLKEPVYYSSEAEDISAAAGKLAQQITAKLPPRGVVTQKPRPPRPIKIDSGSQLGLREGQKVVKKDGKKITARLKLIKVYPDSSEAEVESGYNDIAVGDVVHLQLEGTSEPPPPPPAPRRSDSSIQPTRLSGILLVQTTPEADLAIRLQTGSTWRTLGKSNRGYELPEGDYVIRAGSPGYRPHEERHYIRGGTENRISVKLEKVTDMVLIPAGNFTMGATGERDNPPHPVTLKAFYIGKKEVTVEEYQKVVKDYKPFIPHYPVNHAAIGISWEEAGNYCKAIGKRLPTEAEWERACRGPQNFKCGYGDSYDPRLTDARTESRKIADYPLSEHSSNGYGLYDMTGGVWEWCADAYRADIENLDPRNPVYVSSQGTHVMRGGAWIMQNPERRASCVYRFHTTPDVHEGTVGFRCAADAE